MCEHVQQQDSFLLEEMTQKGSLIQAGFLENLFFLFPSFPLH